MLPIPDILMCVGEIEVVGGTESDGDADGGGGG